MNRAGMMFKPARFCFHLTTLCLKSRCWSGSVPQRGSVGSDVVYQFLENIACTRLTRRYRVTVLTRSKSSS